jgi:hypothetical protein
LEIAISALVIEARKEAEHLEVGVLPLFGAYLILRLRFIVVE